MTSGHLTRQVLAAFFHPARPLLVHLIVTRRCNLSCAYCFEYDKTSPPVPAEALRARIDHLTRLRTAIIVLSGGEPLLHPELPDLVAYARARGLTVAINSNAFLLGRERIEELNDAGLYALQVSVDGVTPNGTTQKTLKPLLPKLRLLAEHARFRVRVNTVIGAAPPAEALEVARTAIAFGFDAKCALLRRADGTVAPLDAATRDAYAAIARMPGRSLGVLGERFQDALLGDGTVAWKCRAGARFFHVCEDGRVHLCAPRWGTPGTPLAELTVEDLARWSRTGKPCAATCPIAYAHQASRIDALRAQEAA